MADVKKEKQEVEVEILNNVTQDDFINATAALASDDRLGKLVDSNLAFLLLLPLIAVGLWKALVELKDKNKGEE